MSSEWLKVMREEIARKKAEAEESQAEERRRDAERDAKPEGSERGVKPL